MEKKMADEDSGNKNLSPPPLTLHTHTHRLGTQERDLNCWHLLNPVAIAQTTKRSFKDF